MAGHLLSELNNNPMVEDAVKGDRSGHGIFEDLIPLRKDEIGSDYHTAALMRSANTVLFQVVDVPVNPFRVQTSIGL
jgi:hypothetical protein